MAIIYILVYTNILVMLFLWTIKSVQKLVAFSGGALSGWEVYVQNACKMSRLQNQYLSSLWIFLIMALLKLKYEYFVSIILGNIVQ